MRGLQLEFFSVEFLVLLDWCMHIPVSRVYRICSIVNRRGLYVLQAIEVSVMIGQIVLHVKQRKRALLEEERIE